MKILHCADIHLDSVMESNLSPEQAKERKRELLLGFADMVRYGAEHDARAVLIAGDVYDKSVPTAEAICLTVRPAPSARELTCWI